MGIANANVADMVVDDINASGGLLGRPLELIVEDSATDDDAAEAAAAKMVDEHDVDVVLGGIYSSTRRPSRARWSSARETLYIYPEQYEGQECDPLIFCTGPVPAQQVEPLFPWLMEHTGAKTLLPAVGRLHLAARAEREGPGGRRRPTAARSWARSTSRSTTWTTTRRWSASWPAAPTSCSTRSSRRGSRRSSRGCTRPGSRRGAGQIVCTYFDENFLNLVPAEHVEGLYGCLDYYREVADPFSNALLRQYERRTRAVPVHGRQCVHGHVPRPQAVGGGGHRSRLARHQAVVIAALDHARARARARAVRPRWSPASTTCG